METSETGSVKDFENIERNRLKKNMRFTSRWICLSTPGCLTFTATFLPLQVALQTWLTEPEANGFSSNYQKTSQIFFPYNFSKFFLVSQNECWGAFSLKWTNCSAMSAPMISLRWLIYWNALIQTTPAIQTDLTKTLSHIFLVASKYFNGNKMATGEKISRSWKNLKVWHRMLHMVDRIDFLFSVRVSSFILSLLVWNF